MSRRFANPPGSARRTSLATRIPALTARFVMRTLRRETRDRGHVLPHDEALAQLEQAGDRNAVTWIGHMSVLLQLDGKRILADPWWSQRASPFPGLGPSRYVAPALAIEELPPIDAVIVSHSHRDHLDLPTIERVPGKERIAAIVPLGLGDFFRERGYGRVAELDWHEWTEVDGVRLTALPAIHYSQRMPFRLNETLWAAFAIEGPSGTRILFGGDSDYGPVHKAMGERSEGFDLALLSIGGYHNEGVHCTPEDCVRIGADLGARALVPLHWGTIYLGEGPPLKLSERFAAAARQRGYGEDRVWIMRIGETRLLLPPLKPAGRIGNEGAGMTERSTEDVFLDHLRRADAGDVDGDIATNFAADCVLLTTYGTFRGHDGVREAARLLQAQLGDASFVYHNRVWDREVAFLEWSAAGTKASVRDGADSFVVRHGRIVAMTIHYTTSANGRPAPRPARTAAPPRV